MSLTSRIQALIDYANETTDAGDTLLGDAVKTLADGYHGGGGAEIVMIQDENNENLRPRWAGIARLMSKAFASNTDSEYQELAKVATLDDIPTISATGSAVTSNNTIIVNLSDCPRYVAYYKFGSNAFPLAHIGRYVSNSGFTGVYTLKALRNVSATLGYIFDLHQLREQYNKDTTPSGIALYGECFLFRTGSEYGQIVGCDDYDTLQAYLNGRSVASAPSSRLAFPTLTGDSLPAKLSPLLAYANSVTGVGDVRLGDAIRTLCEGYGGDGPVPSGVVFYNRLIGDGKAYIKTVFIPTVGDDVTLEWKSKVALTSSPCPISSGTGTYQFIITGSYLKYFTSGSASTLTYSVDKYYRMHFLPDGTFEWENLDAGTTGRVTSEVSKTKQPSGGELFLFRRANLASGGSLEIRSLIIKRNDVVVLDLRPCTKEGVPGLWDMISSTFLGNAGTTGSFTAAND